MENVVILAVLAALVVWGGWQTVKHFQGQSGCCGGGGYRVKRKKIKNVRYTKIFTVEGMHCRHCQERVEEVVNDIQGVAGRADLKTGKLTVSYAEPVDDERITAALKRAGYVATARGNETVKTEESR